MWWLDAHVKTMKTPITDAAEIEVCHVDERGGGFIKAVPSNVARELERCEHRRVPQYDVELRAAEYEVNKWKDIARRLYIARGCKKNEHLRIQAEAAYQKASNAEVSDQRGAGSLH